MIYKDKVANQANFADVLPPEMKIFNFGKTRAAWVGKHWESCESSKLAILRQSELLWWQIWPL